MFSAILPVLAAPFLVKQPKEIVAAVYSAYVAVIAAVAAGFYHRNNRRIGEIAAAAACVLFTGLFVTYVYITYRK
jgi:hypothetical protein